MSFQPKVYKDNSGDNLAVASGGTITVADGGKVYQPVTSSTNVSNYGVSTVAASSGGGAVNYALAAPEAGLEKTIVCTYANSSDAVTLTASTAVNFMQDGVGTKNKLKFILPGVAKLVGVSATQWAVVQASTLVVFPTS